MERRWLYQLVAVSVVLLLAAGTGLGGLGVGKAGSGTTRWVNIAEDSPSPPGNSCDDAGYTSIQAAIAAASDGDEIVVCPGTYNEGLTIKKNNLTIRGKGDGVIIQPGSDKLQDTTSLFSNAPHKAIILVDKASGVALKNLTVDGSKAASGLTGCAPGFFGVFYRGASGTIEDLEVRHIKLSESLLGCQIQLGIFVQSGKEGGLSAAGPHLKASVVIQNSTVEDYGKNGITCNEAGTFCLVQGNTVTGIGRTGVIGQNGIQLGFGAHGAVLRNTVHNNFYIGTGWVACGILMFQAGGTVSDNQFAGNQIDICNSAGQSFPEHPPAQP